MTRTLIIDADTHVAEARDIWTSRMSRQKWGDLIPEIRWDEDTQKETWYSGPNRVAWVGHSGWQERDPETGGRRYVDYSSPVARMEDLHPSCYDAVARLAVMDELGVYAAALYPNLNMIHVDIHTGNTDPEFKRESIAAYNDWLVEWASADPQRLLALALIPHFDVDVAANEVYRAKELGHRGLVMTGIPQAHGEPFLADRYWDPLWAAAEETELPISFHLGVGPNAGAEVPKRIEVEGLKAFGTHAVVDMLLGNATSCADLIMSGILPRHPGLKFVSAEGGIGWVNFMLETLDYHFKKLRVSDGRPEFDELPSFYFRRQVYATYWFEKLYQHHVDLIGAENILFETDYPHVTALEPSDIDAVFSEGLSDVSDDVRERILWRNAAELYKLDVPASMG